MTRAIVAALDALARLVGRLGPARLPALGAVVGALAGSVLRIRRALVERALRASGAPHPTRAARAMYAGLGTSAVELLWAAGRSGSDFGEIVRLEPGAREALERALRRGRGVVLAASHTGNWELAALSLAARARVTIVAKALSVRGFELWSLRVRRARGIRVARPGRMLGPAFRALGRGEIVALMIDQVPAREEHGVAASFLGRPVLVDRAPAALAACTGATMLVTAARRAEGGGHVLSVLDALEPPEDGRRAWIEEASRRATGALERFVREHPEDWLWLHRRWRAPRLSFPPSVAKPSPCRTTPSSSLEGASEAASS